jgi:type II secretory pathway component GspD/PulD (secretin)
MAGVAVAVAVLVLTGLGERGIEYHKREYLKALRGTTMRDRAHNLFLWLAGKRPPSGWPQPSKQALKHENSLIALGYLERREFIVSNRPAAKMVLAHRNLPECFRIEQPRANVLVIVAPKDEMPIWEEVVRKADVP